MYAENGVTVDANRISHSYGDFKALDDVSLNVGGSEFMTLLGASGSGKSTLLHSIAGLIRPEDGAIYIGDTDVTKFAPEKRDLGFVFQNYALFPHMSVYANVAFPFQMRKTDKNETHKRVMEALDMVGLAHMAKRLPTQLSGGQQQRVALARAIGFQPRVLLLDEPLGALDRQLRHQLGVELRRLQREIGITTLYVTHDQEEAFLLSNRIAVMSKGKIEQVGTPDQMYRSPENHFVATFLGDLNSLDGAVTAVNGTDVTLQVAGQSIVAERRDGFVVGDAAIVGFRPEDLHLVAEKPTSHPSIEGTVATAIFSGSFIQYEIEIGEGVTVNITASGSREMYQVGDRVHLSYEAKRVLLFPAERAEA
ncbi:ABC transporter ATP-binding protein [Microbacterium gorillae]|uniref:ABC transporter ATP-binding protein n=1 Tax=Microbacterium gorillae TaxID=1231063 RepID=UPI00058B9974|nr:ABC transporter ATP-binding protein [Microbacterium gorillae]